MSTSNVHFEIRTAIPDDLTEIVRIYNQSVLTGFETADIVPVTIESRKAWFVEHVPETYPIYVVLKASRLIGWVSVSPYRPGRGALKSTVEISYYVDADFRRQGVATMLLNFVTAECKRIGYKNIFAIVIDRNSASMELLKKANFEVWGTLPNVAEFNGVECNHIYFGKRLF